MHEKNNFWHLIRNTKHEKFLEIFIYMLFIILGTLAPMLLSMLFWAITQQTFSLDDFTKHGEFAIYSASLLASVLYLLFKNFKGPFPYRDIFGLLSIIALLLSVGIFLTLNAFDKLTTKTLNISLINSLSLWLFGSCILITFLINILDNAISLNDIRADIETTQQNLANEFDKIGD